MITVKKLDWHGNFGKSPVGQTMCYRVAFNENGAGWGYPEKGRGYYAEQDSGFLVSGPHETHELAKAAAQADYEARIHTALSAQVQDVAGSSTDMKALQSWVYQQRVSLQTNDPEYFAKYGVWKAVGAQIRLMLSAAPAPKHGEEG